MNLLEDNTTNGTFADHISTKAENTKRRKRADLRLFEKFLQSAGVPAAGLFENPQAWRGVTYNLVKGFVTWQLQQGYAIGSINGRLSTVRTFTKLAVQARAIPEDEGIRIIWIRPYSRMEGKRIDKRRRADGQQTRVGTKKAEPVIIPDDIAQALTTGQPDTPQGRRDALLMCLFLEHGLRVGEVAILTRQSFDLQAGMMAIYRPMPDITQRHAMTQVTRKAAEAYLKHDAPVEGIIWRKSCKGTGKLSSQLSPTSATRALTKRVELLGRHAGIEGLSANDGRHYWTTFEARNNTPIDRLKQAGGWSSLRGPIRHIQEAEIANERTASIKRKRWKQKLLLVIMLFIKTMKAR